MRFAIIMLVAACGGPSLSAKHQAQYDANCAPCHAVGAADAPKTQVEKHWGPRRHRGLESLVQTVKTGNVSMPPRGRCYDCSDEDLEAIAKWMAGF